MTAEHATPDAAPDVPAPQRIDTDDTTLPPTIAVSPGVDQWPDCDECGNTPSLAGFHAVDDSGTEKDQGDEDWKAGRPLMMCGGYRLVIDLDSLDTTAMTYAVVGRVVPLALADPRDVAPQATPDPDTGREADHAGHR